MQGQRSERFHTFSQGSGRAGKSPECPAGCWGGSGAIPEMGGKGWSSSRLKQQLCPQPRGVLTTPGAQTTPNSPAARTNHRTGLAGAAGEEEQGVAEDVTAH